MRIGLTGGMGCGKSTAAKLFESRGFRRLDADAIVHRLLADDVETRLEIVQAFGRSILGTDDQIDRAQLGSVVFADNASLQRLEAILHPRVREHWESRLACDPGSPWIVEIPLLFEKNLENRFDNTVCVFSDLTQQLRRLKHRGLCHAQALRRIHRQLSLPIKAEKADFVLLNDGSLEFLESQIDTLLDQPRFS